MNNLDELREKLYKEQYFDYDESTHVANHALEDVQNNLKTNILLLDFVLKSLKNQGILIKTNPLYYIVVHHEYHKHPYKKEVHKTYEAWAKVFIDQPRDSDIIKEDKIIDRVFASVEEAEDFIKSDNYDEILKFEKYTVKKLDI